MSIGGGERTAPGRGMVALDLDLSLVDAGATNVEFRKGDILAGPVERNGFDVVTARAVLHHLRDAQAAIANLVASVRRGGSILLIEPDFFRLASPSRPRSGRYPRFNTGIAFTAVHARVTS